MGITVGTTVKYAIHQPNAYAPKKGTLGIVTRVYNDNLIEVQWNSYVQKRPPWLCYSWQVRVRT